MWQSNIYSLFFWLVRNGKIKLIENIIFSLWDNYNKSSVVYLF